MRWLTLAAVLVAAALLAALELLLQPLYIGSVPAPVGTVLVLLTMPWLVHAAADVSTATAVAASPLVVWVVVLGVLGFAGPGGDVLLPATWQSLLLLVAGLLAGLLPLRRIVEAADRRRVRRSTERNGDPHGMIRS
ncbi:hypothetical protein LWC35_25270 [Pseudonocardia kujensis]|uniref:hypothetical protein n=1 Tax=Pseudonocardia kujensis TaxID=1128675 RepID=UPI001E46C04F|nr:hypothetical protein [Pseudonocardia kujensis]MCE0766188.1 hypothetical protein [Pseudonocardia kujensis]